MSTHDGLSAGMALSPELAALVQQSKGVPRSEASSEGGTALVYLKKDGVVQKLEPAAEATEPTTQAADSAEETESKEAENWEDIIDSEFKLRLPEPQQSDDTAAYADAEHTADADADGADEQREAESAEAAGEADTSLLSLAQLAAALEEPVEPVLLVNLTAICGFKVNESQCTEIAAHLRLQLNDDFIARTEELFEIGACVHCTTQADDMLHAQRRMTGMGDTHAIVKYPPRLQGLSVAELWAEVAAPGSCRAVEVTLEYLRPCSRNLLWKHAMRQVSASLCVRSDCADSARADAIQSSVERTTFTTYCQ
jgi:hypothetical protein